MKPTSLFKKSFAVSSVALCFASAAFAQQYVPTNVVVKNADSLKARTTHKNTVISFGFLSPLNHHISFGYDQLIHGDKVLSTQLGIIGIGINQQQYNYSYNPVGAFIEAGLKFYTHPDYYYDGMHRFNTMQGFYIKPQLVVSVFSQQYNYYSGTYPTGTYTNSTGTATAYAAILNFGKQWVIDNFAIDLYIGVGYYGTAISGAPSGTLNEYVDNAYSFTGLGESGTPLAFTAGINLGIAL